mgnify:CR=1 FL=1
MQLLISHFQQLLVIWQLDIAFPPVITRFVNLMGASTTPLASNPFVYLPVCLLPTHTPEQQARLSYLFELLMPFVSVASTLVVWFFGCVVEGEAARHRRRVTRHGGCGWL